MSLAPGVDEMPGASYHVPKTFLSPRDGDLSPAIRQQFDDFLKQRLEVLPAPGDFLPGCHCSTVLLYLFANEQGRAPWGPPAARAPSPAAGALI